MHCRTETCAPSRRYAKVREEEYILLCVLPPRTARAALGVGTVCVDVYVLGGGDGNTCCCCDVFVVLSVMMMMLYVRPLAAALASALAADSLAFRAAWFRAFLAAAVSGSRTLDPLPAGLNVVLSK